MILPDSRSYCKNGAFSASAAQDGFSFPGFWQANDPCSKQEKDSLKRTSRDPPTTSALVGGGLGAAPQTPAAKPGKKSRLRRCSSEPSNCARDSPPVAGTSGRWQRKKDDARTGKPATPSERRCRHMMRSRDRCFTRSCGSPSLVAGRCVVHRCTSRDVHRSGFFFVVVVVVVLLVC